MNLKNKVSLLLISVYLVLLIILVGQRWLFDIPELETLQKKSDFNEVERVVKALEYQQLEVSRFTYDYGVWNDSYEFMTTHDSEYIEENFVEDTFKSLAINAVLIFNSAGELIWSAGYSNGVLHDSSKLFAGSAAHQQLGFTDLGSFLNKPLHEYGMMPGKHYPLIYSRVSILPTQAKGEPNGTFVMIRILTPEIVAQLSDTSQMEFNLYQIPDVGNNKELAALAPQLDLLPHNEVLRKSGYGYRWLKNLNGEPIALLQVKLSQAIYQPTIIDSVTAMVLILATVTMLFTRIVLEHLVIKPLEFTRNHLKKIRETANYKLRIETTRNDEIGELSRECDSLVHYVSAQEEYLKTINQDLTQKALEDGLTEVANRRHFDVKLELLWRAFSQSRNPLYLVLLDVDHFKAYNDNYGHLKGDETLKAIASVLLSNIRVNTDMVARYGGEEFVIILTETDMSGVKVVCDKLLAAIRMLNIPHEYSPVANRVTVSMGVAGWVPSGNDNPDTLISAADEALYHAKNAGRDCVQYHIRDDSISR